MPITLQTAKQRIEQKVKEATGALHLEVIDESDKHAGHAGAILGKGHFVLRVVSERFQGVSLLDRNRMIYGILTAEMESDIHALTIKAMTPSEWEARG